MLKNDTLKNGTSRIGLYGSASPGVMTPDSVHAYEFTLFMEVKSKQEYIITPNLTFARKMLKSLT